MQTSSPVFAYEFLMPMGTSWILVAQSSAVITGLTLFQPMPK